MKIHRKRVLAVVIVITCFCSLSIKPARAQEIWFGPLRTTDVMELARPDAPWAQAAARVKVFILTGYYLSRASQDDINHLVADLNRRHIDLALAIGVMNVGPAATHPPCGGWGLVEGYGTTQFATVLCRKIKRAGGTLRYIAMDEPLWFGHFFNGRPGGQPGCHSTIPEILDLIQPTLAVYSEAFPGVSIGDIEPTDIAERLRWQSDLTEFVAGFQKQTGRPLAFMQLDVPFLRQNEERFAVDYYRETKRLKQTGLIGAIGLIYNGTPDDPTDEAWVSDAEAHIRLLEDKDGLHPDQALIQSWTEHPQHALPESSPGSLTSLINYYANRPK